MVKLLFRHFGALALLSALALGPLAAQCGDPSGSAMCYTGQCYVGGYCADNTVCLFETCGNGFACSPPQIRNVNYCTSSLYRCSPVYTGCASECVYCG
jgi:hypothetical protein